MSARLNRPTGILLVWGAASPFMLFPLVRPAATAVALVLLLLSIGVTWRRAGYYPPVTALNPFILVYLTLTLIAFLVSPLPADSLPHLILVGAGVIGYFAAYAWLDSPDRLQRLFRIAVQAGGVLALVGLVTVAWPSQYVVDLRPFLVHLPRIPGDFSIHPNEMAGVLVLLLPLACGLWPPAPSPWLRTRLAASVALMSVTLLLTQSRNAWLALVVAWIAYQRWGRGRFAPFAIALVMLIAIPFALNALPQTGLDRLQQAVSVLDDATKSGEADEPSWLSRLEIWRVAGQMAADYPVLGGGLYTFEPVSRANYLYTLAPPQFRITHAHNMYLQAAVSLGFVGLLALVGVWGVTLLGLCQRRPQPAMADGGRMAAVVGATLVGYLWFNLFDMVAWEQKPGLFIWVLLAAALRLSPQRPVVVRKRLRVGLAACLAVALCLLILSPIGQQNWRRLRLDRARFAQAGLLPLPVSISPAAFTNDARRVGLAHWQRQERAAALQAWQTDEQSGPFARQQGLLAYEKGELNTAIGWFTLALQLDETDGLSHYWLGMAYEDRGNPELALRQYDLALAMLGDNSPAAPVAEVWEGRGRILAGLTEWQAAAHAFAQAAAIFPDNPDYAQQLRQIRQLLQEMEEAGE